MRASYGWRANLGAKGVRRSSAVAKVDRLSRTELPLCNGCDNLTFDADRNQGASERGERDEGRAGIHSDSEIMGGTPVFAGPRVSLATLLPNRCTSVVTLVQRYGNHRPAN